MTRDHRERLLAFGAITAVFFATLFPEFDYVPVWDGRVYANCAVEAAASGLTLDSLRCAGHPSQGYAAFLAFSQMVRLGDVRLLHLTDTLLGLLALASFRVVLARVFPAPHLARDLDLVTLACAVHPVVLSTLVQVNIDFGVYVFFFATLAALVSGRYGWTALAGLFLCFSKETGVLAYLVMVGLDALFRATGTKGTVLERLGRLAPMSVTAVPVVAYAVHVLWWNATHAEAAVWKHQWQRATLDGFNFFDLSEPVFRSYASGIFLLGFMWVVSAIIGADLVVGGARMARHLDHREVPGADRRALAFVTTLTVVLAYLLTSFRTWSNLRYFALLYPLLVLLAFAALLRLGLRAHVRAAVVALVAALFVFATYRSSDPVSRAVYGTFPIGDREMYRMASITGEFGGPGRDQLVYNLEFTGYHQVQNALFLRLRPTDSTAFATSRAVRWNIWSQLDARTWRRTLARRDVIVPRYADEVDLAAMPNRPRDVWFLEFSNHADTDRALASLGALYRETAIVRVHARGHVLRAHHLVRREAPVLP
ncbi:MAG TPA: hypothetical protein VJL28_03285 [Gemmatimonadaceae bacterium]|nr:hypothetical protein [Gemmatimonadaceae bacterium]